MAIGQKGFFTRFRNQEAFEKSGVVKLARHTSHQ